MVDDKKTRLNRYGPIAFAILVLVGIALVTLFVVGPALLPAMRAREARVRVLGETDYQQLLLNACRELSVQVRDGTLSPGQYNIRSRSKDELPTFPQIIIDLMPTYVHIYADGRVMVELFGFPSYGVMAYPVDYRYGPDFRAGDVELIPGLWYYDEDYDHDPEHKKIVDSWRAKGRVGEEE
jgi:hypothetical protein